jgi:hypothetical protein
MDETPTWKPAAEPLYWLNEVEKMQGVANGLKINLRAAVLALALGEPVSATVKAMADEPDDWTPVAWITRAGRLCLQDGDGPVKAMPQMDEECDFIIPLYDRHTVAELARTARVLAMERAELRHEAMRALVAWDGTVLPKAHDELMQERMESLRAALAVGAA